MILHIVFDRKEKNKFRAGAPKNNVHNMEALKIDHFIFFYFCSKIINYKKYIMAIMVYQKTINVDKIIKNSTKYTQLVYNAFACSLSFSTKIDFRNFHRYPRMSK